MLHSKIKLDVLRPFFHSHVVIKLSMADPFESTQSSLGYLRCLYGANEVKAICWSISPYKQK